MNPELLLKHFDRISGAPGAIPRLRQFILELAVRGKLVDRDQNDEPASELLKRIQKEKDRQIERGKIKKQKPFPRVTADEASFGAPPNWCWVRLGAITEVVMGQSPPGSTYNKTGEGVPLINGPVEFTAGPFGNTLINQYTTAPTNFCEAGDLLLCVRGSTTGRTNVAAFRACIGRGVAAIRPFFADRYVRLFIWSVRASIIAMGRGIAFPSVSRQQVEFLPVPLPPLAEQDRIVSKVDELMALCDRLEASLKEQESRRVRLSLSSLHHLSNAENFEAFNNYARFYLAHLRRLTTRTENIQALRQTILDLGVRGQLVRQDPQDEPALEVIKRIQFEKTRLVKQGTIKKSEQIALPSASDFPSSLPSGWAPSNLQSLCISVTDGDHLPPPKADEGIPFLVIGNVRSQVVNFEGCRRVPKEYYEALDASRRPQKGDVLYTLVGSYGIPILILEDKPFCVQRHIGILRPFREINARFLSRILESSWVFNQATACATGIAQKTVPLGGLRRILIPLPPIAEQGRIVAKIDELMALCDRLEAQVAGAQSTSRQLLEAILNEALDNKSQDSTRVAELALD
jgi:type I restriction enzyme S subunit